MSVNELGYGYSLDEHNVAAPVICQARPLFGCSTFH